MITYPVAEKFVSINGEGPRAGELAVFIRFRGCNLNCGYCDTKWANTADAPAQLMTAEEIAGYVEFADIDNVTLTGGEPLLQKSLSVLTDLLIRSGRRVEIETNGSVPIGKLAKAEHRPAFTMDYKLPSSGMEDRMCLENFACLEECDTVKFVSGTAEDLNKALEIIKKYSLTERCHVYFSPVFGSIDPADIVEFMKSSGLNGARLQLQLHKFIWDPQKRGV